MFVYCLFIFVYCLQVNRTAELTTHFESFYVNDGHVCLYREQINRFCKEQGDIKLRCRVQLGGGGALPQTLQLPFQHSSRRDFTSPIASNNIGGPQSQIFLEGTDPRPSLALDTAFKILDRSLSCYQQRPAGHRPLAQRRWKIGYGWAWMWQPNSTEMFTSR